MTRAKSCLLLMVLASFLLTTKAVERNADSAGTYLSATELASKVAHTTSGVGYEVASASGYKVLMIQRDATGEAEVHMMLDDTIIIERGTGKFRVGGHVTGNREIRPTEWRGGTMSEAHEYTVSQGDLLLIPAGTPHQAVVTSGPFMYLTIKTPKASAPPAP